MRPNPDDWTVVVSGRSVGDGGQGGVAEQVVAAKAGAMCLEKLLVVLEIQLARHALGERVPLVRYAKERRALHEPDPRANARFGHAGLLGDLDEFGQQPVTGVSFTALRPVSAACSASARRATGTSRRSSR